MAQQKVIGSTFALFYFLPILAQTDGPKSPIGVTLPLGR